MIPRIIHYCWLSDEPLPKEVCAYVNEWEKIMPDYKIKKWDKQAFDIHSSKWVEQAYENKKWAFAADYIRAYALYTEGGFYLDSDVKVCSRFDSFLKYGFVSSIEYNKVCDTSQFDASFHRYPSVEHVHGLGIQAAIIGSTKGHSFPLDLLKYYNSREFVKKDGTLDMLPAPVIYSLLLEKRGFIYSNREQSLQEDIKIFKANVFADFTSCTWSSKAIHMCNGSWVENKQTMKKFKFLQKYQKNLFLRKLANMLNIK